MLKEMDLKHLSSMVIKLSEDLKNSHNKSRLLSQMDLYVLTLGGLKCKSIQDAHPSILYHPFFWFSVWGKE